MKTLTTIFAIIIFALGISSCGTTHTAQSASTGAFIGGMIDGWDGVAAGALIGGGVGMMADAAEDMQIQQEQRERELEILEEYYEQDEIEESEIEETEIETEKADLLAGSSWKVISFVDDERELPNISAMVLTFQENSKVKTLIIWEDGKSETYSEKYNIVSDALIFTGEDYVTNTKFSLDDQQLVVVSPTTRMVLKEIEEAV